MRTIHPTEPDHVLPTPILLDIEDLDVRDPDLLSEGEHGPEAVSFEVGQSETVGLLGERDSGASAILSALAGLTDSRHWSGRIRFDGRNVAGLDRHELHDHRSRVQIVFGDPDEALDPARTVAQTVTDPLRVHRRGGRAERQMALNETLELIGLDAALSAAHPSDLTPPERMRVAIGRAVVLRPSLVLLDHPVARLRLVDRRKIIDLLVRIKAELSLTYLIATGHPATATEISDRLVVFHRGHAVEVADRDTLLDSPAHPYTQRLLASVPLPRPSRERRRAGMQRLTIGEPDDPGTGCVYAGSCPRTQARCTQEMPDLHDPGLGHPVACHYPETISRPPSPVGED